MSLSQAPQKQQTWPSQAPPSSYIPPSTRIPRRSPRLHMQRTPAPSRTPPTGSSLPVPPSRARRESGYTASVYSERSYDDLYDVSDDDSSEVVPLQISNSVKQHLSRNDVRRESLPSLVIPSPTAWPTIQKLRQASLASKTAEANTPLSPAALAKLASAPSITLRVPAAGSTPSLDGSLNSDEIASISPSTPDLRVVVVSGDGWDMPMQLNAEAMETLQHLSPNFAQDLGPIVEVPESQTGEMQEKGLNIDMTAPNQGSTATPLLETEPVSAISLPSPGGFLASLAPAARDAWAVARAPQPSTATAETFYDVPWDARSGRIVEQVVSCGDTESEGPPTARQQDYMATATAAASTEMVIKPRVYEYDDDYERKLYETAASNKTRTSMWLSAQETYLSALKGNNPANADNTSPRASTDRQSTKSSPEFAVKSPSSHVASESIATESGAAESVATSKKAVRFDEAVAVKQTPPSSKSDPLFYHAFQHLSARSHPSDAFDHGRIRADALQAQRLYISQDHRAQLRGQYKLAPPKKPAKDFAHLPQRPDDPDLQKQREAIAQADRERQALSQISLAHWHLEASRMLSGGSLLSRSVREAIAAARRAGRTPRVLDLGGQPTADWGWAVALEQRDAKVYTAVTKAQQPGGEAAWPAHRGPSNHRTLPVNNPWTLPFPAGSFDVVSARSLQAICRTQTPARNIVTSPDGGEFEFPFCADFGAAHPSIHSEARDEYAATLAEVRRVLAPGGVFHYQLLDAEVASAAGPVSAASAFGPGGPVSALQARSSEFASALSAQGFDPAAGRRSAGRMVEAGFRRSAVNENWVELPIGGHNAAVPWEADIADATELIGSVAWERWALATRGDTGLSGFADALESARRSPERLAWRILVGVARR